MEKTQIIKLENGLDRLKLKRAMRGFGAKNTIINNEIDALTKKINRLKGKKDYDVHDYI